MAAQLLTFIELGGYLPAAGGTVNFYQPGTLTPITVYSDDAASQVITQPVSLDQNGRPTTDVYALVPARAIVKDSTGAQLRDISRCNGQTAGTGIVANASWPSESTVDAVLTALGTSLGGTDGNFLPSGTGAVQRSVQSKLSEKVSVKDYNAKGDGITNDYTAIVAAMTAVNAAGGGVVEFPAGTYVHASTLAIPSGVSLKGLSPASSILSYSGSGNGITLTGINRTTIEDIGLTSSAASTSPGILLSKCGYCVFSRVRVTGFQTCFSLTDDGVTPTQFIRFLFCELIPSGAAAGRCILFGGTATNSVGSFVLGCVFNSGPNAPFSSTFVYVTGLTSSLSIVGCTSSNSTAGKGLWIDSSHTGAGVFALGNTMGGSLQIDRTTGPGLVDIGNGGWLGSITDASDGAGAIMGETSRRPLGSQAATALQSFAGNGTFTPSFNTANFYVVKQTTAGSTVTIQTPGGSSGGELGLVIWNGTAGAATWSWNANYVLSAAVNPGAGLRIAITFRYDPVSTLYYEMNRSAAY
jgi:hypothetical protein